MDDKGCLCIATDCASSEFPMNDTAQDDFTPDYPVEERSVDCLEPEASEPEPPGPEHETPATECENSTISEAAEPIGACDTAAAEPAEVAVEPAEVAAEPAEVAAEPAEDPAERHARCVIEAFLFSSESPLSAGKLAEMAEGCTPGKVRKHIEALNEKYAAAGLTFRIESIARGYQMMTLPEYHECLGKLNAHRQETRLSGAALETLSIIAYKQPVIRADVEAIRGVASGEVVNRLREMGLVRMLGRAEIVGRPLLYGTTKKFLDVFGLADLDDLPPMEALQIKAGVKAPAGAGEPPASRLLEEAESAADADAKPAVRRRGNSVVKQATKPHDEVEPTPPPPIKATRKLRSRRPATPPAAPVEDQPRRAMAVGS